MNSKPTPPRIAPHTNTIRLNRSAFSRSVESPSRSAWPLLMAKAHRRSPVKPKTNPIKRTMAGLLLFRLENSILLGFRMSTLHHTRVQIVICQSHEGKMGRSLYAGEFLEVTLDGRREERARGDSN